MIYRKVVLSRRNLEALLDKLDEVKRGGQSACMIIKSDTTHPDPAMRCTDETLIKAVEDEDYYTNRGSGLLMEDVINHLFTENEK